MVRATVAEARAEGQVRALDPDTLPGFLTPDAPDRRAEAADILGVAMPTARRKPASPRDKLASWCDLARQAARTKGADGLAEVYEECANSYTRNGKPVEIRLAREEAGEVAWLVWREGARVLERLPEQPDANGLHRMLWDLGCLARWNERSAKVEFSRDWEGTWHPVTDNVEARWKDRIAAVYWDETKRKPGPNGGPKPGIPIKFSKGDWDDTLLALADRNSVDPFRQWLECLPRWDGTPLLDTMAETLFLIDPDTPRDLARWVSAFLVLGPIARTFRPGLKLDETPALIGPQGIGKSTLCELILPPSVPGLFKAGFPIQGRDQEMADAMRGKAIVEIAEMAGVRHADLERLKLIMARTDDETRLSYRKNPEPLKRRSIFVATGNNHDCLPNDPTGNRRWVVLTLREPVAGDPRSRAGYVREWLEEHRAALWAEGLARYRAGQHPRLPDRLAPVQREVNFDHRDADPFEEIIARLAPSNFPRPMTVSEIAEIIGAHSSDKGTQYRIARSLKNLGWTQDRKWRDGSKLRVWKRPEIDIDPMDLI